jgi:hypothetical protein
MKMILFFIKLFLFLFKFPYILDVNEKIKISRLTLFFRKIFYIFADIFYKSDHRNYFSKEKVGQGDTLPLILFNYNYA